MLQLRGEFSWQHSLPTPLQMAMEAVWIDYQERNHPLPEAPPPPPALRLIQTSILELRVVWCSFLQGGLDPGLLPAASCGSVEHSSPNIQFFLHFICPCLRLCQDT